MCANSNSVLNLRKQTFRNPNSLNPMNSNPIPSKSPTSLGWLVFFVWSMSSVVFLLVIAGAIASLLSTLHFFAYLAYYALVSLGMWHTFGRHYTKTNPFSKAGGEK